eukprot:1612990-Pleurochrysis_carterae.AAC.1
MPGSDPNHLAHHQPRVVMRRAAGFRPQPPGTQLQEHCFNFQDVGRVMQTILSLSLAVAITHAVGDLRSKGDQHV